MHGKSKWNHTGTQDRTGDLQRVRLTSQPLDHTCLYEQGNETIVRRRRQSKSKASRSGGARRSASASAAASRLEPAGTEIELRLQGEVGLRVDISPVLCCTEKVNSFQEPLLMIRYCVKGGIDVNGPPPIKKTNGFSIGCRNLVFWTDVSCTPLYESLILAKT